MSDWYKDYLNTEEWKSRRLERMKLDNYTCRFCGSKKDLQVHHVSYDRIGDEDINSDLITLCRECHSTLHGIMDFEKRIIAMQKEEYEKRCREAILPIAEDVNKRIAWLLATAIRVVEGERKTPKSKRATIGSAIYRGCGMSLPYWKINAHGIESAHTASLQIVKKMDGAKP